MLADPDGSYTPESYEEWFARFDKSLDQMATLASQKMNEEQRLNWDFPMMWDDHSGSGGDQHSSITRVVDDLRTMASSRCQADTTKMAELRTTLEVLQIALKGSVAPDNAPPGSDIDGASQLHTDLATSAKAWKNDTGELFQRNFVRPIPTQLANQADRLSRAGQYLDFAENIVVRTRLALESIPTQSIVALNGYNPLTDKILSGMSVAFTAISIPAGPAASTKIIVTLEALPEESGLTVSGLMTEAAKALVKLRTTMFDAEAEVIDMIEKRQKADESRWSQLVCRRPSD